MSIFSTNKLNAARSVLNRAAAADWRNEMTMAVAAMVMGVAAITAVAVTTPAALATPATSVANINPKSPEYTIGDESTEKQVVDERLNKVDGLKEPFLEHHEPASPSA